MNFYCTVCIIINCCTSNDASVSVVFFNLAVDVISRLNFFQKNVVLYKRIKPAEVKGEWVFNQPFFIIMNIAVGGNFVGPPNENTPFPGTMTIDYVRAYKEK